MADVFISYSRGDQAAVRQLAEAVRREGYSVWWDEELPPHRSYSDVITEQIDASKAAIVVWSAAAAASEWVRAEADLARNRKKLIQTSLDAHLPPMPFNQIQFAAIGDWRGETGHPGWCKVKESLAALCGPAGDDRPVYPLPAAPPPAPARAGRSRGPMAAAIALLLVVLAAVALFAWPRREAPPPAVAPVESTPAPATEKPEPVPEAPSSPAPPRETVRTPPERAEPPAERASVRSAPANPRLRRYCLNRGRDTPRCRRLRAQSGE
jgi:TIR domain-containing protein